jgi:hypothetical protein
VANGRNRGTKGDTSRDAGGFVALPWSVLDCPAYARLSHPAKALLFELARQFVRDNNGRLLASRAYLAKRGWRSPDVIARAKNDLIESGFIHETVKGHRPNKASWFAVTWRTLDKLPGYDAGAAYSFKRAAYMDTRPIYCGAVLSTSPVLGRHSIGMSPVLGRSPPSTSPVPIRGVFDPLSSTSPVHHLEKPSPAINSEQGIYKRLTAKPANLFTNLIH